MAEEPAAHADFESKSAVDLVKVGMYRYAEHPSTWPWMLWWRIGDGVPQEWRPGWPDPTPLLEHVARGGVFKAHNVGFERQIWNVTLRSKPEYRHWPRMEIEQTDCSMVRALALHLPAELGALSAALGLGEGKSDSGRAIMLKMSKPRKRHADGTYTWWDDEALIKQLGEERCKRDVEVECAVDAKLPPLSPAERKLWERDQRINDRGVRIDEAMAERCVKVLAVAQDRADARMRALTEGVVGRCTEATRIVAWLRGRGFNCGSIAVDAHEELIGVAEALGDDTARQVIELRAEAARNSTAKFQKMLDVVCEDGRARGLLNFHRASTGRWGGALIQPQNLPRVDETELPDVLAALEIMERFV